MKFKEFLAWCNERCCDGYWGMNTAIVCTSIIEDVRKNPFWRREKVWKEKHERYAVNMIVNPIEDKLRIDRYIFEQANSL